MMGCYILGIVCGFAICHEYFRHQITKKKNPDVIAKVKRWLDEARELR